MIVRSSNPATNTISTAGINTHNWGLATGMTNVRRMALLVRSLRGLSCAWKGSGAGSFTIDITLALTAQLAAGEPLKHAYPISFRSVPSRRTADRPPLTANAL